MADALRLATACGDPGTADNVCSGTAKEPSPKLYSVWMTVPCDVPKGSPSSFIELPAYEVIVDRLETLG